MLQVNVNGVVLLLSTRAMLICLSHAHEPTRVIF